MNNSNNKIKENKYKILRMSLLLGNGEDREETINNFEDASREIDVMNDEIYQKNLEEKFYDTLTLEEEEKKLSALVDYIGGRVEQRLSLLNDFTNVTGRELNHLPPIKYYDQLEEYKERLGYIREYISNTSQIEKLTKETNELETKLDESYLNKAELEEKNKKYEIEALNRFMAIFKTYHEFSDINGENINLKLDDINREVADSKKSLDIFEKSFRTLNRAGINAEEEEEYSSYVDSAKKIYYDNKEKEYLLNLYLLFERQEVDYFNLLQKRNSIDKIISDRQLKREELGINTQDKLLDLYDLLNKQYDNITSQQENINNIDTYTKEIEERKQKINELKEDNNKVEILSLLKEFCIIDTDTYDDLEIPNQSDSNVNSDLNLNNIEVNIPPEKPVESLSEVPSPSQQEESTKEIPKEELKEISTSNEKPLPNQIINIEDATKIDLENAIIKSNNVMKRVGETLGIKASTQEIVSVSNDSQIELSQTKNVLPQEELTKKEFIPQNSSLPNDNDSKEENTTVEQNYDIFQNNNFDADPETTGNDTLDTNKTTINPLFNNLGNTTLDEVMANNKIEDPNDNSANNNWFSTIDENLDLNKMPDIEPLQDTPKTSNPFEDFKFPDLETAREEKEEQ